MIVLYRIDNRLIHGQVLEGWVPFAQANTIVLVSADYAADEDRQQLLRSAAGPSIELFFMDPAQAAGKAGTMQSNPELRAIFIFAAPHDLLKFLDSGGLKPKEVNVGGMHYAISRLTLGRYQTFSDEDRQALGRLSQMGIRLDGRSTPWDEAVDMASLLTP